MFVSSCPIRSIPRTAALLRLVTYKRLFGKLHANSFSDSAIYKISEKEDLENQKEKSEIVDKSFGICPTEEYSVHPLEERASSSHQLQYRISSKVVKEDSMESKDVVSLSDGASSKAIKEVNLMKSEDIISLSECALRTKCDALTPELVSRIMRSTIHDWQLNHQIFLWAKQQPNYKHASEIYELIVHILGKAQKFEVMWNIIEQLARESYLFRPKFLDVIFRSYAKAGSVESAFKCFERLNSLNSKIGAKSFNSLIRVLCQEKKMQDCGLIFERMKGTSFVNETSYSILLHGYCEANLLPEVLRLLEEMIQENIQPSLELCTSLIQVLSRNNMLEIARKVFERMKVCILQKFNVAANIESTVNDISFLCANAPGFDAVTYDNLVVSLCMLGELDEALKLLDKMMKKGFAPSARVYKSIFYSLCKRKKSQEAFDLLNSLAAFSVFPDLQTLNSLIETFCSTAHVGMAIELWDKMHKKGYVCGLESYCVLIHGLCYNSLYKEAFVYFKEMTAKGFVPLLQTSRMLQIGFQKDSECESLNELKMILKQLEAKGIKLGKSKQKWRR